MTDRNIKTHPLIDRSKMSLVERQVSLDALAKLESSLSKIQGLQDILKQVRESQAQLAKAAQPTQGLQDILKQVRESQAKLAKAVPSQQQFEDVAKSAESIAKVLEHYGKR